uniref:ABCA1-4-like C-terminal R2 regulatory domain-containing protein n=1 Tax=Graphocephala atropunctata TaxID=36148 RepID=A0A1B6M106_9HEMI
MEECEALCSRLTIMVAGQMKCIGSAPFLKQQFGQGYTVKVKLQSAQSGDALTMLKQEMMSLFENSSIKDEHLGLLDYHIPDPSLALSELFQNMERLKSRHNIIEDYNVSDTTLEQVFMFFARASLPPEKIL